MVAVQPVSSVLNRLKQPQLLLIDGKLQAAASGETYEVHDPATGKPIASVAHGASADIDLAVSAARQAFNDRRWRGLTAEARSRILLRLADLVEAHAGELAYLDILNNGMTLFMANALATSSANRVRSAAALGSRTYGKNASAAISGNGADMHAYTAKEPVGVVGLILPWNGPMASFLGKVSTALAAGCTCIVKPAEATPLTALLLGELALEAGVPPGVVNVIPGFGDAGQALVDHPDVDKISFTGSTAVGKQIVRSCADNLKRVTLELGGKSANIIFDDADMAIAIPGAANAIFMNSGQACLAGSRLFVQRRVLDTVLNGLSEIAGKIVLGSGFNPETQMGPLVSQRQLDRVTGYIEQGRTDGAKLVIGGGRRDGAGYFVEPTIFLDPPADSRIYREEIFGPVLVVNAFDTTEEVVEAANDTRYGLAGGVFTTNVNTAHLVAGQLRTGTIWVNCYGQLHPTMPFGGYKESGWGREIDEQGLEAFLETKSVFVKLT
ncbi:Betaine-aldehyde dehydrogenase [Sphingobium chlorophenolicum L-1]|uniref:Betaine-aldehyde dehydrogenase n=1 Tax=Sphingobium chlorophenolicum L-1 TaxID=690566 RepID=F6EWA2_SPHCR|nr:aldehyde dehydrogenase family protein [Sphingobium chlorophenolicum]AEG49796.1 Betaine-aldehyde dehydrogenase [Sphingobium chlorophenolicum L-1]